MEKTHTGEKRPKRPRVGFSIIGKAHTVLLYEFLPSDDMGRWSTRTLNPKYWNSTPRSLPAYHNHIALDGARREFVGSDAPYAEVDVPVGIPSLGIAC
jgi:hypothetical protein